MKSIHWQQSAGGRAVIKRIEILILIALPVVGLTALAAPSVLHFLNQKLGAQRLSAPYRYELQRPEPGSITLNLEREIAFYQERIQRNPNGGLDRALLAKTYLKMARATGETSWYLLAQQTAQASLVKLPFHNDGAILALARVATAKHDFVAATKLAERVAQNEETLAVSVTANLAMGQVEAASQAADRLVEQNPDLASLTSRALVNVSRGRDQAAMQDFQQGLKAEEPEETGSSVWARTVLGRLYFKRGQLDMAESLYQEALRVLPQYPPAMLNLAELEVRRGQYYAAEQLYSKFFLTSQKSPTVYDHIVLRGMARVKDLQGDKTSANDWRNRAEARLRQDLTTFGHRRELARLLLERGRPQDLTAALTLMQQEVQVRRDAETMDTLAWVLSRLGRWQEAQQAMQTALRSGIRDAALLDRSGMIALALGHTSQANEYFKAAQAIDPTFNSQARQALGLGVGLLGLN